MGLKRNHVKAISAKVHKQFPELKGVSPKVSTQAVPKSVSAAQNIPSNTDRYSLIFTGTATLPGGRSMQRVVRVIADNTGKVLKIALSK